MPHSSVRWVTGSGCTGIPEGQREAGLQIALLQWLCAHSEEGSQVWCVPRDAFKIYRCFLLCSTFLSAGSAVLNADYITMHVI